MENLTLQLELVCEKGVANVRVEIGGYDTGGADPSLGLVPRNRVAFHRDGMCTERGFINKGRFMGRGWAREENQMTVLDSLRYTSKSILDPTANL